MEHEGATIVARPRNDLQWSLHDSLQSDPSPFHDPIEFNRGLPRRVRLPDTISSHAARNSAA
jgi:hypothetical protein